MMTFEDLECWQMARKLVRDVYALTRHHSIVKDLGLCGQAQRAAVSIMNNIAEGFERTHVAEKLQFYNIARGSCGEVRSLCYVIDDNYAALRIEAVFIRGSAVTVGKMISGLVHSTAARRKTSLDVGGKKLVD